MPPTRQTRRTLHKTRKTRRTRVGKDALINIVNDEFQEMMRSRSNRTKHFFFQSVGWFKFQYNQWSKETFELKNKSHEIHYNPSADISLLTPLPDCKFIPTKTLTSTYLKKFYEQLKTTKDYVAIRNKCHDMTNYALPSPLKSLDSWKHYKDPNAINVMILGTGPVGLFTALQLHRYYNKFDFFTPVYGALYYFRKVNILLVDNRILKEGVKMPYSRSTGFNFSIEQLQPFLNEIFCWNMEGRFADSAFEYIHVLENLLYTVAYNKKISMAFTKQFEDYEALKSFVDKEQIHVLFDCTGGRSRMPISYSIPWNKFSFKEKNQEVHQNPLTKYYEFWEDGKVFSTPVLRLQLFGKNKQEILVGHNDFAEPIDSEDIALATKYNNICFKPEDFVKLASRFKKEDIRYLFPFMLEKVKLEQKDIKSVKLIVFDTIARHSPFAAAPFHKDCVLIRVGDSLAGTEYGIMFGMRHSIEFSKHICNLLSSFL